MDVEKPASPYYVLGATNPRRMLLYEIPDPGPQDSWFAGQRFHAKPEEPLVVQIQPGYEARELLPYFGTAPIMSHALYEALRASGVDNLDGYEAIIRSEDGKVEHRGYKAFNVVGLVRAADLAETRFSAAGASRLIDASIERLVIAPEKARDLLMFRLAEYVGAVIVHARVKAAVERLGFPHLNFQEPGEFIS